MIFSNLILGILTAYIGSIPPSMLNMTAAKISLEKDKKTALQFAIGVSSVVFIQALLALLFLKAIHSNPLILDSIQIISIIIFMVLSIVFLKKALNEQKAIIPKKSLKNGFLTGIGLSFINMFSIPFYCGIGAVFNMYGWLS
jgi:threonine/homoserine/homoserine lactone efflux protein